MMRGENMFKRKSNKPVSNSKYKPTLSSSNEEQIKYRPECSVLAELRDVQSSIEKLEQRKRELEQNYFPMIYWVIAEMLEISKHVPSFMFRDKGVVDRESIEMALKGLREYFSEKNINSEKFDVDKFCGEVRDYIYNNEAIESTSDELKKMLEKQKQIKESLDIK